MLFNSLPFLIFFLIYAALHALCPARWRLWLVVAGSAIFYGYWNWHYAWLPFALTGAAFTATRWTLARPPGRRRGRLAAGIILLLAPLILFKYANFLWLDAIGPLAGVVDGWRPRQPPVPLSLPLGISFVTFTLLAYLIDYATGRYRQPLSLKWLLGYVLFFPHLISGPILRPHELIPQLQRGMKIRTRALLPGLALIACGLVKKMVFADQLGPAITHAYSAHGGLTWPDVLLAVYGFPVQIYCDLSGYTDMALGLARVLGVRLPGNFRQPYCAGSITEFWQRWHITLTHWFRDYVFFTLPGSRRSYWRALRNVVITMALTGAWHGARWTFVVWGLLHGLQMVLERLIKRAWRPPPPPLWLRQLITFHIFALLAILFRAGDFSAVSRIFRGLLGGAPIGDPIGFVTIHSFDCLLIGLFFLVHRWDDTRRVTIATRRLGARAAMVGVAAAMVVAIAVGMNSTTQFIYFDF